MPLPVPTPNSRGYAYQNVCNGFGDPQARSKVPLEERPQRQLRASFATQPSCRKWAMWLAVAVAVGALVLLVLLLPRSSRAKRPIGPDVEDAWDILPSGYCEAAEAPLPSILELSDVGISAWAMDLASRMTPEEQMRLVKGVGWSGMQQLDGWYVGNILAVPRLGVPSVQMQDASQGFRTTSEALVGQVTAWPCALALAAGWDVEATQRWAQAMGEEFKAKGANVVLGPGVNVHRVALNGRNAEYLSGEDPFLGAPHAAAYVKGMQDGAGVAAVVKHFLMNEQEGNRTSMDVHVDERTRWEQYYPPFQAAVKAGVAAVMCSYNLVNGQQACSNSQALNQELKGTMGFKGWVMSDWWALQNAMAATAGTDQEQPGSNSYFSQEVLAVLPPGRLDNMVVRVLHGMARGSSTWRSGQTCRLGCTCSHLFTGATATSSQHVALARELAASSAVLLKNDPRRTLAGPTLPLQPGETVAVLGSACAMQENPEPMVSDWLANDYYVVGGSGRVLSPRMVSVLQGLRGRGLRLKPSPSEDPTFAQAALQGAAVAIVCGGATTAENSDRVSLRLDQQAFIEQVIELATAVQVPVVVVALAPGAIVAPWRHGASAILALFLSGQETGNAAADVLLGTVSPSGKLPVTFPDQEGDALAPCVEKVCEYRERLQGGWHVYDGKPVAFPFGHGLSYTQFSFSAPSSWSAPSGADGTRSLSVQVRNVGTSKGAEVVQLYVGFPPEAERPELSLRGFRKTRVLGPGETCEVQFTLGPDELSVWDVAQHSWRLIDGHFRTKVGSSSRDLRICGGFDGEVVFPMGPC